MVQYSVKQLAKLAGVSVRTLHLYDGIGLLKPSVRTEARYRLYGNTELLRLQQVLFYKELGFPLQEICSILDDPDFDLLKALAAHRQALSSRQDTISIMIKTIDKTISHLKKGGNMLTPEELYEGLPKETAEAYRQQALTAYGEEAVNQSENALRKMSKAELQALKAEQQEILQTLAALCNEDPASDQVQKQVARHYQNIRRFWGTAGSADPQARQYAGLGNLYVEDDRFITIHGKSDHQLALFLSKAMAHFADAGLK